MRKQLRRTSGRGRDGPLMHEWTLLLRLRDRFRGLWQHRQRMHRQPRNKYELRELRHAMQWRDARL